MCALWWPSVGLANDPAALASAEYTRPARNFGKIIQLTKNIIPFFE
jgi:hypothetical protein